MINLCLAAVLGAATWGVLEYLLHRFLGHRPSSRTAFAVEHRAHHSKGDYFAPTAKKAAASLPLLLTTLGVGVWFFGAVGGVYAVALSLAYVGYEWFHRRLHTHAPSNAYGRWARRHHFHHHFGDPRSNHGVTSPVMDWVFGTAQASGQLSVPRKLAMGWLVDPTTGEVRAEFSNGYRLAGGGRAAARESVHPAPDLVPNAP